MFIIARETTKERKRREYNERRGIKPITPYKPRIILNGDACSYPMVANIEIAKKVVNMFELREFTLFIHYTEGTLTADEFRKLIDKKREENWRRLTAYQREKELRK